eukprot:TRINITY_DN2272_c0_g1_i6.p1 TRINITY_DN2272_c0_g1~~TRINITY_DN2272_c0_g1_i6.p1  ORF type:complete len:538 (+),score=68.41 TRINITY_DN2272_c0_g1_i6:426-2039(+)
MFYHFFLGNQLKGEGYRSLLDSLKYNTTITQLNLFGNSLNTATLEDINRHLKFNIKKNTKKDKDIKSETPKVLEKQKTTDSTSQDTSSTLKLDKKSTDLLQEKKSLEQTNANLLKEIEDLKKKLSESKSQCKQLSKKVDEYQESSTLKDSNISNLKNQLKESDNLLHLKIEENSKLTLLVNELSSKLDSSKDIKEELKHQNDKFKKLIETNEKIKHSSVEIAKINIKNITLDPKVIAAGSYGRVMSGTYSCPIAVKFMHEFLYDSEIERKKFIDESRLALLLRHPNLSETIGYGDHEGKLFICSKLEKSSLKQVVETMKKSNKTWKLAEILKISSDIAVGMEYLHANNIIHRDMNLGNFLVSMDFTVKITDFGLAKQFDDVPKFSATTLVGAPFFMAPEVETKIYDNKCDVWSYGMIISSIISNDKIEDPAFRSQEELLSFIDSMENEHPEEKLVIAKLSKFGCKVYSYFSRRKESMKYYNTYFKPLKQIIFDCMKLEYNQRPDFSEVKNRLNQVKSGALIPNINWFMNQWKAAKSN